ncbi:MAG: HIT domain-containing protein [Clostridia bacterium]|nr:HIT domain-containing protein [Clostridia bacterium]
MDNCIFCKIANNVDNPVYEDDKIVIIKDINPQAKIHYLVIPKKHFNDVNELSVNDPDLLSHIFKKISDLKNEIGFSDGFRIITNIGKNGRQSVKHVHFHLLGGEELLDKMG